MKHFRNPANIHPPVAGYTHRIEVSGAERLLFLFAIFSHFFSVYA